MCRYTAPEPAAVQTLILPPWVWRQNFSKFCLYLFLTCVFAGMHVGFGGVHAGIYLCLNGLLCGQKCVIPPITVEKPN